MIPGGDQPEEFQFAFIQNYFKKKSHDYSCRHNLAVGAIDTLMYHFYYSI